MSPRLIRLRTMVGGDVCCPGSDFNLTQVGRANLVYECLGCHMLWHGRQRFEDGNPTLIIEYRAVLPSYEPGMALVDD